MLSRNYMNIKFFFQKMKKTSNKTENIKYKVPDIRNGEKSCLK